MYRLLGQNHLGMTQGFILSEANTAGSLDATTWKAKALVLSFIIDPAGSADLNERRPEL